MKHMLMLFGAVAGAVSVLVLAAKILEGRCSGT